VQQASDTKDGGSKIMESFSSLDEGDQKVKVTKQGLACVQPSLDSSPEQRQHSFAHVSCLHTVV